MAGPGRAGRRCFAELERLEAYRLDLLGSVIGIVGVHRCCRSLSAPPVVWFAIVAALFAVLLGRGPARAGDRADTGLVALLFGDDVRVAPQSRSEAATLVAVLQGDHLRPERRAGGTEWQV